MSVDIFLKLDGIEGDATNDKYKGWINVLTFSWGSSNTGSLSSGGGAGSGKAVIQDFSFVKEPDSASPKLFESVCTGKHIRDAQLSLVRSGEDQQEFMKIKMSDVLISNFQTGGSAGMIPAEQISFSFSKLELSTTDPNGGWETHGCDFASQKQI